MATTKKATYKRYNGTDWDTIAFATYSSIVTLDSISSTLHYVEVGQTMNAVVAQLDAKIYELNASCSTIGGRVTDLASTVAGHTTDISDLKDADTAIKARIKVFEDAWNGGSGSIITTDNMKDKVEITGAQVLFTGKTNYDVLNDTTVDGALDTLNKNYSSLKTAVDGKQNALTFDTTPTANSSNPVTSGGIKTAIDTVAAIAQGKTTAYVIHASTNGSTSTEPSTDKSNGKFFVLQTNQTEEGSFVKLTSSDYILTNSDELVSVSSLKVGDFILTREAYVKDWFLGLVKDGNYFFYEIDSDKPNLEGYATTSAVESKISAAIGSLDSSKDAGSGKYLQSITITDGKITGGTVGTIPTSLPASNTTSEYSSTGTAPVNGTAVNKALSQTINDSTGSSNGVSVSIGGTIQSPTITVSTTTGEISSSEGRVVSGGTVYSHVAARATKIFYADSASSVTGMIDGDICILTGTSA